MNTPAESAIANALGGMRRLALPTLLLILGLVSASHGDTPFIYGGGTFSPQDQVRVSYYLPRGSSAQLELYRVNDPANILKLGGPDEVAGVADLNLTLERRIPLERHRSNYNDIRMGQLPLGLYYAQLTPARESTGGMPNASATLILVTDLGLVVKADEDTLLTYTAHLPTSTPRKTRVFLQRGDKLYAEGLADDQGLTEFDIDPGIADELVVAAKYGASWVFSDAYWNRWAVEKVKIYLNTDRSVYRPGHTVFFKGTARMPSGLRPLSDTGVQVVIRAADGSEIFRQSYTTDRYGSFDGQLVLGVEPPLGSYTIETTALGETDYANFFVEEFQKPEYRVSVEAAEAVAVQGDRAHFTVAAEYLFGGAVVGGKVSYAVLKQPHFRWRFTSRFGFYQEVSYNGYYGGEMIERGEGVLDANGQLIVELELPPDEQDYQLTLQAGVTDEARREISGSGSLVAYRSGVVMNVSTERYANKVGDDITVTVQAEDIDGNPASVPFVLEAERRFWVRGQGSRSEPAGGWRGRTDEDGLATLHITLDRQGSYRLSARASDAAGRQTSAGRSLWVSGDSRWFWAYDGLSITTDKPEYQVGDTARFVIQSPVADAYLLISREGDAIDDYEVVELDGSVLTYEFTVTDEMTPNGYLSVALIGGGEYYLETAGFRVPPADKFLNVEITSNAESYRPRDTGTFAVRISDARGQGVHAQLALGLVDEAIYLVRPDSTPDIRGFFYALKDNLVGTQIAAWYRFNRAELDGLGAGEAQARAPLDEAVFAQGKADFAPAEVRQDFRDTILWLPTVETDDDGLATVEVTFPDNLTEWRLTARAITLGDEVGQQRYRVTTTLPVIARLAAPRFFISGDEASLRVVGQNNLDSDQVGQLELSSEGLLVHHPEPQAATLPAGGRASADFNVLAGPTGSATVTATALTPEASDAVRLPIPVLPHGIREEIAWADSGDSRWEFSLPSSVDLGSSAGTLYLTPSLAAAVSPALSYLAGYPYGCTEQTMSRFLPSVLAAQAGELAQLPEDVADNLDDMVQKGLKRLTDFQHQDGGWGFWKYDSSNLFISAYVINGLLDAKKAGYQVRDFVLGQGITYLEEAVKRPSDDWYYRVVAEDGKAYAYYALARAGSNVDGIFDLARLRDLSPYGLALSSLAFVELGREVEANLYLDELLSRTTERQQLAFWDTRAPRYYWNDDDVEATAYALEALVRLRPEHPLIAKVVNWLLLQRKGSRWIATKDTAAVVKAALTLAEQRAESEFDFQVSVTLNGQEFESRRIGKDRTALELPLTGLKAGRNELQVKVLGQGTLFASAAVHYVPQQDYLEPESEHLTVRRSYQKLTPVFDEVEQRFLYKRSPLGAGSAVGDYLLVTVEIDPQDEYRYVLVNEPLPAGYRVVENDRAFRIAGLTPRYGYDYFGWNYWYDGRDVRDERVDYYFSYLADKVTFTYILRAETPGTFTALPTVAWLMYDPDIRGVGKQATLEVVEDAVVAAR